MPNAICSCVLSWFASSSLMPSSVCGKDLRCSYCEMVTVAPHSFGSGVYINIIKLYKITCLFSSLILLHNLSASKNRIESVMINCLSRWNQCLGRILNISTDTQDVLWTWVLTATRRLAWEPPSKSPWSIFTRLWYNSRLPKFGSILGCSCSLRGRLGAPTVCVDLIASSSHTLRSHPISTRVVSPSQHCVFVIQAPYYACAERGWKAYEELVEDFDTSSHNILARGFTSDWVHVAQVARRRFVGVVTTC